MQASHSKLKTLQTCEKQYVYKYVEGITPKKPSIALTRGSWFHALLEAYDKQRIIKFIENPGKSSELRELAESLLGPITITDSHGTELHQFEPGAMWTDVLAILRETFYQMPFANSDSSVEDLCGFLSDLMDRYIFWERRQPHVDIIASEITLESGDFKGRIDRVVIPKDRTGQGVLQDYKTTKGHIPDAADRVSDLQQAIYCTLWNEIYGDQLPVDSYGWIYVKTADPSLPKFNQDGSLSKKSCTADKYVWLKSFADQGLTEVDIPTDRVRDDSFFRSFGYRYRPSIAGRLLAQTENTKLRMQAVIDNPALAIRILHPMVCTWCDYNSLCKLELIGLDTSIEREAEYMIDPKITESENV